MLTVRDELPSNGSGIHDDMSSLVIIRSLALTEAGASDQRFGSVGFPRGTEERGGVRRFR